MLVLTMSNLTEYKMLSFQKHASVRFGFVITIGKQQNKTPGDDAF